MSHLKFNLLSIAQVEKMKTLERTIIALPLNQEIVGSNQAK